MKVKNPEELHPTSDTRTTELKHGKRVRFRNNRQAAAERQFHALKNINDNRGLVGR